MNARTVLAAATAAALSITPLTPANAQETPSPTTATATPTATGTPTGTGSAPADSTAPTQSSDSSSGFSGSSARTGTTPAASEDFSSKLIELNTLDADAEMAFAIIQGVLALLTALVQFGVVMVKVSPNFKAQLQRLLP